MPHPTPAKLRLLNMVTQKELQAQFNPNQLGLVAGAVYNKQPIPGQSHTVRQFSHTEDVPITFDLYFRVSTPKLSVVTEAEKSLETVKVSTYATTRQAANAQPLAGLSRDSISSEKKFSIAERRYAENFLSSLTLPVGGSVPSRAAPPRCLIVWPNFLSFEAIMLNVSFNYTQFNYNGHPIEFTASCKMEEFRDTRYTMEDVYLDGWQRSYHSFTEER